MGKFGNWEPAGMALASELVEVLADATGVERATLTRLQQGKRAAAARRQGKTAS